MVARFPLLCALLAALTVGSATAQDPCLKCDPGDDPPFYAVEVTPDGGSFGTVAANTGGHELSFTIENTGNSEAESYSLSCSGTNGITCTVDRSSVALSPGSSTTVTVTFATGGTTGSASVTLTASSLNSSDTGSYSGTIVHGAPVVDLTPYNASHQQYGRCLAACFGVAHARSTAPYFSLGAPRSVTLAYHGDRANPRPFVHVNVSPNPNRADAPSEYRFQVKVNGALVTFVNGEQTLRFAGAGWATVRLGGQFDASGYATNTYPMEVIVGAVYSGSVFEQVVTTKTGIVNEINSPIARGWTVAGIQRLYPQADGGAWITEGEGSAVQFAKSGSNFVSPGGEFSQLVTGTPSGGSGWTRRWPDSTKVVFNSAGRMIELRDRFNNTITVVYDASNRVSQVKDPLNLAITLTYDANGLTAIQDPMGRVTDVAVDASRRLTAITDPDNVSTTFGYDASLRLQTITNRRGHATTLGYDVQSGKLATVTAPAVQVLNADGVIRTAAPVTSYDPWQKKGVPYGSTATPVGAPLADTVYARITDPGGHTTRFTVNRWGAPIETTDPLGGVVTVSYDANGLPVKTVSPTGAVDTVAYNTSGLPIYLKPSGQAATNTRYAAWAQPDSVWGEKQPTTRRWIGANGRVDSSKVTGNPATVYTYDARGRVEQVKDPRGHLVQRTWYTGVNGNQSKDSLPGGRVTLFYQDAFGRDTAVKHPVVPIRRTHYDVLNRPIRVYDGVNANPTVTTYDALYATSVTDPAGQVYGFGYNALGWLVTKTDPQNRSDHYLYSRDGEQRRWTNRRGQVITYAYDALHRPASKGGSEVADVTWTYSANRRVITASDAIVTETHYLGINGQLDSARTVWADISTRPFVVHYRYTPAGLLDSLYATGGGLAFRPRQFVHDTLKGTVEEIRLGASTTGVATNEDLQAAGFTLPGGAAISRQYYALHDVAEISTTVNAGVLRRSLSYDLLGRVQRQVLGDGGTAVDFAYDDLSRVGSETFLHPVDPQPCDGDPPPLIDEDGNTCTYQTEWVADSSRTYTYDGIGNRTDQAGSYDTGNRITGFAGCTYATDFDGNVTSRSCASETVSFSWTAENRLAGYSVGTTSVALHYDAAGRLVRKDLNGSPARYFLWDGDNLLAELSAAGTAKVAEYSSYGLDRPHALIVRDTVFYAHTDGLGNVIALTDSAETIKRTYVYDAWGQPKGGSDLGSFNGADRARFKGALWVGEETELYYMRARWYEPKSGRFLSEDPIGLEGRDQSVHLRRGRSGQSRRSNRARLVSRWPRVPTRSSRCRPGRLRIPRQRWPPATATRQLLAGRVRDAQRVPCGVVGAQ